VIAGDVVVRDHGLLTSAAADQRQRVRARCLPGVRGPAAALMHSSARNHALIDGNKQLAWSATRVFCLINGRNPVFEVDEAEQMVLAVACGDLDAADLAEVLGTHIR
jgi:death-on-curing protein